MDFAIETFDLTKKFKVGSRVRKLLRNRVEDSSSEMVAVDHVNLRIERGDFVGLLGPNGAGKTTLIKMLCTLIIPTSGSAKVNGYDIVKESQKVRASVALVQSGERSFYWRLTGRQNLEFFAALYDIPRYKIRGAIQNALEIVELDKWANEKVMRYSMGMRQRLSLARGLLLDTPIFLMDEPTLGLDVHASIKIREFIKRLCIREEKTILYATHFIKEAEENCNKVAIIHNGRIIALDSPAKLRNKFGNNREKVIELEMANPSQAILNKVKSIGEVKKAALTVTRPEVAVGRMRVHTCEERSVLPKVLDAIITLGGKVEYVQTKEPTLEDVFISLTGVGLESEQQRDRPLPFKRKRRLE